MKKLNMFSVSLIALSLGAIGYTATSINADRIRQQEINDYHLSQLMQTEGDSSPLQQVPMEVGPGNLPPVPLPADATPTQGYPIEPGSIRPAIIPKPKAKYRIVIEKTPDFVPSTRDPIWIVALLDETGKKIDSIQALSGRASKQTANRHKAGTKSPLPAGEYSIDISGIARGPFDLFELGRGYWIPVEPLFQTGRSALGFHQDPSWGKLNGESGTDGCVGFRSSQDTEKLVDWIRTYRINRITVVS